MRLFREIPSIRPAENIMQSEWASEGKVDSVKTYK